MSRLFKRFVLTALVISMLGCNVQPLFSYADEDAVLTSDSATDTTEDTAQEEAKQEAVTSAEEESSEKQNAADASADEQTAEDESSDIKNNEEQPSDTQNVADDTSEQTQPDGTDMADADSGEIVSESDETAVSSSEEEVKDEDNKTEESSDHKETGDTKDEQENVTEPGGSVNEASGEQVLADGIWKVLTSTDDYMFHIAGDSEGNKYSALVVDGNKLTATITLTGTGYDYLYMGTKEEAAAADKSDWSAYKEVNGYYTYTFAISSLDKDLTIASHSKRLDQWYQHTIHFSSDKAVAVSLKKQENALADGTWKVVTATDDYMFHIAGDSEGNKYSVLVVDGDKLTATITLTGTGYDYLYMGTKEEAAAADKSTWSAYKEVNGYYTYTFDISSLDKDLTIASHSKRLDQWYQHTISFSSDNAVAVSLKNDDQGDSEDVTPVVIVPDKKKDDTEGKTSGTQKKFKNDNKADKESKYTDDSNKSTKSVDNGTTLKDGVYTPDGFSWAGGTGRLAYIRCNKLTVKNGKVYATIEFGSDSYDQCKASGNIYYKNGSGLSTFVIPVELNKNNTIIARTTAMSSPHWVKYTIYIGKSVGGSDKVSATDKKVTEKLSEEAPSILGLESTEDAENAEVIAAKYFQIFSYDNGVKLIQVDMNTDTYMQKKLEEEEAAAEESAKAEESAASDDTAKTEKSAASEESEDDVEYDEEGNPIAKSQTEITEELYQNKIVNYLVVPENVEIPAGLDKTYILIQQPADKTFAAGKNALKFMNRLNLLGNITTLAFDEDKIKLDELIEALKDEKLTLTGHLDSLDYKAFVLGKTNMALLPACVLPDVIDESETAELSVEEQTTNAEAKEAQYVTLTTRFTTLGIPVLVDRSADEETKAAKAEWIKVYGIIYGCEDEADAWFAKYVKKYGTEEEIKALEGETSSEKQ